MIAIKKRETETSISAKYSYKETHNPWKKRWYEEEAKFFDSQFIFHTSCSVTKNFTFDINFVIENKSSQNVTNILMEINCGGNSQNLENLDIDLKAGSKKKIVIHTNCSSDYNNQPLIVIRKVRYENGIQKSFPFGAGLESLKVQPKGLPDSIPL